MCPKIAYWYVGCVDVNFLLTSHYLLVPEIKLCSLHKYNSRNRPNYPHFMTKEVSYKNWFDSLN